MAARENNGRFSKGNDIARKPIVCPSCGEELEIKHYAYLKKKD